MSNEVIFNIGPIFDLLEKIVILLTPAVLSFIAYKNSKREKIDKSYRQLRGELDTRDRLDRETKDKVFDDAIVSLSNQLNSLTTKLSTFEKETNISSLTKQVEKLVTINEFNFQYNRSLSSIVNEMGEAIQESSNTQSTAITEAIDAHIKLEKEIENLMHKMIY